jgi:hypothetical protein
MTKRKFSKLLNKEVQYTAIKGEVTKNKEKNRIILKDVRYKNKVYADHVWVFITEALDKIPIGTRIAFTGTAYMYNDKFNTRKQGLKDCHGYHEYHEDYNDQIATKNLKHMYRRISKG